MNHLQFIKQRTEEKRRQLYKSTTVCHIGYFVSYTKVQFATSGTFFGLTVFIGVVVYDNVFLLVLFLVPVLLLLLLSSTIKYNTFFF